MHRHSVNLRSTCWVAILAILMLALAPTVSSLLRGANYAAWVTICRTATLTGVAANAGNPATPDGMGHVGHHGGHCPYCALHADALPPSPRPLDIPHDVLPTFMEPQAFLKAPSVGHLWRHAPSRAPPRLS